MWKQLRLKTIRNCHLVKNKAMDNCVRYVIHRLQKIYFLLIYEYG